ncbi:MAG: Rieske (2Fe-2S) protein [Ignavibacteriales bacterium]|nr:Rieske (2Fe-2S) protein [Ignavibacteriales bacterium]
MPLSRRNFLVRSTATACGMIFTAGLQSCNIGALLYSSGDIPLVEGKPALSLSSESALQKIGGAVKKRFAAVNGGNVILIVRSGEKHFSAFAAQCTHMGAEVNGPTEGLFICPFHGSQYSAADGKVIQGPAEEPLLRFDVQFDESKQEILIQ